MLNITNIIQTPKNAIQMANWILRNIDSVKLAKCEIFDKIHILKWSRLYVCKKSGFLRNISHCPDLWNHPDFGNLPGGNLESECFFIFALYQILVNF